MSVFYRDCYFNLVEGSFDKVFDTREDTNFLKPYFSPISFNAFRTFLNTLYCKHNYKVETPRLFHSNVRSTGILKEIYADESFIDHYAFTLPFFRVSWGATEDGDSDVAIIHFPTKDGGWSTREVEIKYGSDDVPLPSSVSSLKEALIDYVAHAFSCFIDYTLTAWVNEHVNYTVPGRTLFKYFGGLPFIKDKNVNQYLTAYGFSGYPLSWKLKFNLFKASECLEIVGDGIARSRLYQVFQYSTPPSRIFGNTIERKKRFKGKKEYFAKGPTYGVELELSCDHEPQYLIDTQEEPFFILKSDVSISGSGQYAYEAVTLPMDYRSQRIKWGKWFASIWDKETESYKGFDYSRDTTNGMHVHVGVDSFKAKSHAEKFLWFFIDPVNHDFMLHVSERGELDNYCAFPQTFSSSRKNDYRNVRNIVLENGRSAVCITGKNTYEIRLFKGLVSYATVLKNLELVDAVYYFTEQASYAKMTATGFLEWLCKTPKNKYKMLKKFLQSIPESITATVPMNLMFYGCKSPSSAIDVVRKYSTPVSAKMLTYLNEKFGEEGIEEEPFKVVEGKLILNPKKYATLKHLDGVNPFRSFIAREPTPEPEVQAETRSGEPVNYLPQPDFDYLLRVTSRRVTSVGY